MTPIEKALALLSTLEGVEYIEVSGKQVFVYVRDVNATFPTVSAIFATHAPHIKGQVRGPSYPTRPPKPAAPKVAM